MCVFLCVRSLCVWKVICCEDLTETGRCQIRCVCIPMSGGGVKIRLRSKDNRYVLMLYRYNMVTRTLVKKH